MATHRTEFEIDASDEQVWALLADFDDYAAWNPSVPSISGDLREGARPAAGALMFTCNGRGSHMFGSAGHDAGALARQIGQAPAAGFFCAGEIGPVGRRSFVHGFSTSVALFGA